MFTADEIETRIRWQPFVPVRIITSLGRNYDITHPRLVMIGRNSIMIGVADRENPDLCDTVDRVALEHITDLQEVPRAVRAKMTGVGEIGRSECVERRFSRPPNLPK